MFIMKEDIGGLQRAFLIERCCFATRLPNPSCMSVGEVGGQLPRV